MDTVAVGLKIVCLRIIECGFVDLLNNMPDLDFVDENDNVIGQGMLAAALANGICYRLVHVFLFNDRGEVLLQKRSPHVAFPGLWDSSASGHVDAGEDYLTAALRETEEEIGVKNVSLQEVEKVYGENSDPDALRKRFDTIFVGQYSGDVKFDEHELAGVEWRDSNEVSRQLSDEPGVFTRAFGVGFPFAVKFYNAEC